MYVLYVFYTYKFNIYEIIRIKSLYFVCIMYSRMCYLDILHTQNIHILSLYRDDKSSRGGGNKKNTT